MLDLDFLKQSVWPDCRLFVYHYDSPHLRAAVVQHARELLGGVDLQNRTPGQFGQALRGADLFVDEADVMLADWALWSLGEADLNVGEPEANDLKRLEGRAVEELMRAVRRLSAASPRGILLVPQASLAAKHLSESLHPQMAICSSLTGVLNRDLPHLIDAIAKTLSRTIGATERQNLAQQLSAPGEALSCSQVCDEIETALVVGSHELVGWHDRSRQYSPVLRPLRALVLDGNFSNRWQLIEGLTAPNSDAQDLLDDLYAKSARILLDIQKGKMRPVDPWRHERAVLWATLLLSFHARLMSRLGRGTGLRASPDLRVSQVEELVSEFERLSGALEAAHAHIDWDGVSIAVAAGASPSQFHSRLVERLKPLVHGETVLGRHFEARFRESREPTPDKVVIEQAAHMPFDEIARRGAALRVFLNGFSERSYSRPLMLEGAPNAGRTRIATAFVRSFLCECTTVNRLEACGTCDGCLGRAYSLLEVDLATGRQTAVVEELAQRIRRPTNLGGSSFAAVVSNIELLSDDNAHKLLLSLEARANTGLIIFLKDQRTAVHAALRSRCLAVPIWKGATQIQPSAPRLRGTSLR